MAATFWAIEVPNPYGASSWVRTKNGEYQGMGKVPTLFTHEVDAEQVVRYYHKLCKNSGKPASEVKIVTMGVLS